MSPKVLVRSDAAARQALCLGGNPGRLCSNCPQPNRVLRWIAAAGAPRLRIIEGAAALGSLLTTVLAPPGRARRRADINLGGDPAASRPLDERQPRGRRYTWASFPDRSRPACDRDRDQH